MMHSDLDPNRYLRALARERDRHVREGMALRALQSPAHAPSGARRVLRPAGPDLQPSAIRRWRRLIGSMVRRPSRSREPRIAIYPPSANG